MKLDEVEARINKYYDSSSDENEESQKSAKGKLALEELTSDEEDGYGYYHQSTDIPVEEKQDHDQDDDGEQSDEDS